MPFRPRRMTENEILFRKRGNVAKGVEKREYEPIT